MIIKTEDIARYRGKVKIPQLGGKVIDGFNEITMYKPVGVVIIAQYIDDNTFDRFIVGAFNAAGVIEEKREFIDKTEKDFFEATKYFEELIEKKQPQDDQKPPAVGKFYFCKKSTAMYPIVLIDGLEEIIIAEEDIPLVFTPPKSKPYGRLDMTAVSKPEYDVIKSKFALKYNVEESEKLATDKKVSLSDVAVYDMTPYSNSEKGEGEDGGDTPDEVNDQQLNANDIEGEDLDDQKQKGKKGKGKDKGGEKDKSEEKDGEKDKGEKGEDGEKEKGDGDKSDSGDKGDGGEKGDGDGEDSEDDNSENESDSDTSDNEKKPDSKKPKKAEEQGDGSDDKDAGAGESDLSANKAMAEQAEKTISSQTIIDALQKDYETNDLKAKFKRQNNLLIALDSYTENELQSLYGKVGADSRLKKEDFINLVKNKTQTLFT